MCFFLVCPVVPGQGTVGGERALAAAIGDDGAVGAANAAGAVAVGAHVDADAGLQVEEQLLLVPVRNVWVIRRPVGVEAFADVMAVELHARPHGCAGQPLQLFEADGGAFNCRVEGGLTRAFQHGGVLVIREVAGPLRGVVEQSTVDAKL